MTVENSGKKLKNLLAKTADRFEDFYHKPCTGLASSPGRINILGEHTDYLEGFALPAAIDCWTIVAYAPGATEGFRVCSENYKGLWQCGLDPEKAPVSYTWHRYIRGILSAFRASVSDSICDWKAVDFLIVSSIPAGKGVSSSAALELSMIHALSDFFKAGLTGKECVRLSRIVENDYLGVPGGYLDQMACQFSREGKISLIDFQSMEMSQKDTRDLKDWQWVCVDTGERRTLSSGAFAQRVRESQEALQRLQKNRPEISCFRDVRGYDLAGLAACPDLQARMRHMLSENDRVIAGAKAMEAGDVETLGHLLSQSHLSLRDYYQVSSDRLNSLQEKAVKQEGCAGARMMGGGFGGCVLSLVHKDKAASFIRRVRLKGRSRNAKDGAYIFNLTSGARVHPGAESHLFSQGPERVEL